VYRFATCSSGYLISTDHIPSFHCSLYGSNCPPLFAGIFRGGRVRTILVGETSLSVISKGVKRGRSKIFFSFESVVDFPKPRPMNTANRA
jgi:hypothetical protein